MRPSLRARLGAALLAAALFAACDAGSPEEGAAALRPLAPAVSEYFSVTWGPGDSLLVRHIPKDPEGNYLYERAGLYVMGPDGGGLRPLVLAPATGGIHFDSAAWSPDGEWAAFSSGGYIHRVRRDGSGLARVVAYPGRVVPALSWAPDSRRLVYNAIYTDAAEETGLWVVDALALTEPRQLLWPPWQERCLSCRSASEAAGWGLFSPAWSPDGRHIAYTADPRGSDPKRLAFYDLETARVRVVFDRAGRNVHQPTFSPDGRHVAFYTTEPERGQVIYVVDLPGRVVGRIGSAGESPAWSPDGREIAFHRHPHVHPEAMCYPGRGEIWIASPWDSSADQRRRQVTFSNRSPLCD